MQDCWFSHLCCWRFEYSK